MKGKILLLLLLAYAAYGVYDRFLAKEHGQEPAHGTFVPPLYDKPYIVVYGRNECGYTRQLISALNDKGIRYRYAIVDEKGVTEVYKPRLVNAGLIKSVDQRTYLPVVDVNATMMIRPDVGDVLSMYRSP